MIIVATGPSLNGFNFSTLSGKITIAVNDAINLFTPTYWFTMDGSDKNAAIWMTPVAGVTYYAATRRKTPPWVRRMYKLSSTKGCLMNGAWRDQTPHHGLAEDPNYVVAGNSTYGALNLAYHFKHKKILFLGLDADNGSRITGGYSKCLRHLPALFESACPQLDKAGIEVANASRNSNVTCFERMTIDDGLSWYHD